MPFIITSDSIRIHYWDRGIGVPLVFIHGLGSCIEDWAFQTAHFCDKCRVIAIDLRGHGRSDKPPLHRNDYSVSRMSQDVREVLAHLNTEPCHLVGLSLGACVSLQTALDFPSAFRSLTLINGPIYAGGPEGNIRAQLSFRLFVVKYFGTQGVASIVARRIFPHPDQEKLRKLVLDRIGENPRWTYYGAIKAIRDMRIMDRLGSLRIPTLVMIGRDDRVVPFYVKEKLVHRLKNEPEVKILQNAGHAAPLDSPEEFNAILREWLDQT